MSGLWRMTPAWRSAPTRPTLALVLIAVFTDISPTIHRYGRSADSPKPGYAPRLSRSRHSLSGSRPMARERPVRPVRGHASIRGTSVRTVRTQSENSPSFPRTVPTLVALDSTLAATISGTLPRPACPPVYILNRTDPPDPPNSPLL